MVNEKGRWYQIGITSFGEMNKNKMGLYYDIGINFLYFLKKKFLITRSQKFFFFFWCLSNFTPTFFWILNTFLNIVNPSIIYREAQLTPIYKKSTIYNLCL